jgi:dipeptidyl aminopeptidase/acylaminoacyl peptidase
MSGTERKRERNREATVDRDITNTEGYRATEQFFRRLMEPGFGHVTVAAEPAVRPDGGAVAVTGTIFDRLEGAGATRIAIADERSLRLATSGPHSDRAPCWSPDGRTLAFLSDRAEEGVFALYLLRDGVGEATATPPTDGTAEYCGWSPDGRYVLLGVAGRGADLAGGQGSGTTKATTTGAGPAWLPDVQRPGARTSWRSAWVYDVEADAVRKLSPDGLNVWEAAWLGSAAVAAVASAGDPDEDAWYAANLVTIDLADGTYQVVYKPRTQLGWPAGSPDGRRLAVVEALCSDRWIVAGELRLIDLADGTARTLDIAGADAAGLRWIDERRLGYTGVRGLETVVGRIDVDTGARTELFAARTSSGPRYAEAAFAANGAAAVLPESYEQPQRITLISGDGVAKELASLADAGTDWLRSVAGSAHGRTWTAPDGLEIQGIVCRPAGAGPFPLVVQVHGGPVWLWRDRWRMGNDITALLVSRGYAVLLPNPRGSSGRGQDFVAAVRGDMGGADALDILAGIDALVDDGVADPARIGVTGVSYGGLMSCRLVTQDQRFAAAVGVAPVTNWISQHYGSNIGGFDKLFLDDDPANPGGRHFRLSPVAHAGAVRTPTLLIAGARDRCTPPGQAVEFHTALRRHGVDTELVVYPEEGHGVRRFPARVDAATRLLAWFERYMPADHP